MKVGSYIYTNSYAPADTNQLWVKPMSNGEAILYIFVDGKWAPIGGVGESAYEAAVKAGFNGSKEEWLDSLALKYSDLTAEQKADLVKDAVSAAERAAQAVENIENAINDIDVSSTDGAITALVAKQGALENKVDVLGLKIDEAYNKTKDAIVHNRNYADTAIVMDNLYINSSSSIREESGCTSIKFPCKKSTTYTISKVATTRFRAAYFNEEPAYMVTGAGRIADHSATSVTITTASDSTWIAVWVLNSSGESKTIADVLASLQIEEGSSATEYIAPGYDAEDKTARKDILVLKAADTEFANAFGNVASQVGLPISITTTAAYGFVKLPYTIPSGTKIINLSQPRSCYGKTSLDDSTVFQLKNNAVTDRPINFVNNSYVGVITIEIDGIAYKAAHPSLEDNSVTTQKIAGYAVTRDKLADKFAVETDGYDIRGCIAEIFFYRNAVVFDDANGYTNIAFKRYNNTYYVMSCNGTSTYGWFSHFLKSSVSNGVVVPIVVTMEGANTNYGVGDTVGYVVFRDYEGIESTNVARPCNIIRANAIEAYNSPMIYSYLQAQNVNIQGVMKYPELRIPSDLYIVSGNPLRVFYKSIIRSYNHKMCGIRVKCNVGQAYPDYYLLQTTTVGNYNATFYIVDNDDNVIDSKVVAIHVISPMSSPSSNKNVLVFGASTLTNGKVVGELDRRLTKSTGDGTSQNPTGLGLSNITFVGRKIGSDINVHQEATGGWSWLDYSGAGRKAYRFFVTGVSQLNVNGKYTHNGVEFTIVEINVTQGTGNIRCTYEANNPSVASSGTLTRSSSSGDATITYTSAQDETYNPFWNPNKTGGAGLDFVNYANEYCNGSIDVMIAHCAMNDFSRYDSDDLSGLFSNYIKPFIRAYHTDFPNGKFMLTTTLLPSPTGGMAANYGASNSWNWFTLSLKVWAFAREAEALCKDSEFSSYVYLVDDVPVFDCDHSYPYEMGYVNNRSTIQEERGTNGVHPTDVGSYQVADSIFMNFNRLTW